MRIDGERTKCEFSLFMMIAKAVLYIRVHSFLSIQEFIKQDCLNRRYSRVSKKSQEEEV